MASPDGGTPSVGWGVVILTQLVYPPPLRMTATALPVGTGKSVESERERERERERGRPAALRPDELR